MLRKSLKILLILVALLFLLQGSLYLYRLWQGSPALPKTTVSSSPAGQVVLPVIQQAASLGINTNEIGYTDASIPFVDLFRSANPFQENVLHLKAEAVTYDANGWPTNLNGGEAGTRFLGELPPEAIPSGEYTCCTTGMARFVTATMPSSLPITLGAIPSRWMPESMPDWMLAS